LGKRVKILVTTIIIALFLLPLSIKANTSLTDSVQIKVEPSQAISKPFLGIGTNWDTCDYDTIGVTPQDLALTEKRLDYMKMPIVRVMMIAGWVTNNGITYDYESIDMQNLRKLLDYCQLHNVTVILTEWGVPALEWGAPNWDHSTLTGSDDPKYAEIIGVYLSHLINDEGYTCIKYFLFYNEPNLECESYIGWRNGVRNVAAELVKRGLDSKVTLMGSDEAINLDWQHNAIHDLKDILGVYDIHIYPSNNDLLQETLQASIVSEMSIESQIDPSALTKPFIIGEAGMYMGDSFSDNYVYGLWMSDYAVQTLRAGSSSVIAWMLDDNSHTNFNWGLWSDRNNGMALKPWFFTWSLLTRNIPRGSVIYNVSEALHDVRLIAARTPTGNWTFVGVNRGGTEADVTFNAFGGSTHFNRYLYSEGNTLVDADGFPMPESRFTASISAVRTIIPPESVVIITSDSGVAVDQPAVSGIPGFTVASVVFGLILGLIILASSTRRRIE
jgi:hypothetical protein